MNTSGRAGVPAPSSRLMPASITRVVASDPQTDVLCLTAYPLKHTRWRLIGLDSQSGNVVGTAVLQPTDGGLVFKQLHFVRP